MKYFVPGIFTFLFFFPSLTSLSGQEGAPIDSLKAILNDHQLTQDSLANIELKIGTAYRTQGIPDSAIPYLRSSISLYEELDQPESVVKAYVQLLRTMSNSDQPFETSIALSDTLITKAQEIDDAQTLTQAFLIRGIVFDDMNQRENAFKALNTSLDYLSRLEQKRTAVAIYNAMANLYTDGVDWEKSQEYYLKALYIADTSGWKLGKSVILNNIADNYLDVERYDEAEQYFKESIAIKRSLGNETNLSVSLCQIAFLYRETDKLNLAFSNAQEGLQLAQKNSYQNGMAICYTIMAGLYEKVENEEQRINYAMQGVELMTQMNAPLSSSMLDNYEHLYQAYLSKDNYEQAFKYLELYSNARDSIVSMENKAKIDELELSFQLKEAEMKNALLAEQQKQAQLKLQRRQFLFYLTISIFVILGFFTAWWVWQKNKLNAELDKLVKEKTATLQKTIEDLEKANEELTHFSYITSHDLKEPLRSINGFVTLLRREVGNDLNSNAADLMQNIQRFVRQMNRLIEDVMSFSLISKKKPHYHSIALKEVVEEVKGSLSAKLDKSNAAIHLQNDLQLNSSRTHLVLILSNLCKNAIHYNKSELPTVDIAAKENGQFWKIEVKDNGIGIAPKYQEQIFVMFKRLHSRSEYDGTGLGLPITKKLIEQLGGHISVESQEGEGSTFTVFLPKEDN
jgi:signal transduction histidine kinase/tetratricopeptide (TPR) repeat protein